MRAEFEKSMKKPARVLDAVRPANPEAIEAERARLACQRGFQVGGGEVDNGVQKSRST
jgi:hypothetical protein